MCLYIKSSKTTLTKTKITTRRDAEEQNQATLHLKDAETMKLTVPEDAEISGEEEEEEEEKGQEKLKEEN